MRRVYMALYVFFSFAPHFALACTCSKAPPGACLGLQKDDVVFLGTVVEIEDVPAPPSGAPGSGISTSTPVIRYHFRVDERFAGDYAPDIDVFSGGNDGDCAFRFRKGEQYLVFPDRAEDDRLFATICSGTRPASDGRALLPQLRAMRNGERVASVFGVLRRSDPPLLAPSDDPDDPLPRIQLKLRSHDDRFSTSTGPDGVYSFYDVHAGEYIFSASLPARMEFTQKTLKGGLPPFRIPNGACYEYNVDALPTGHIRGSVLGPNGKPIEIASVELYRADHYADSRPGLWAFQGDAGVFDFAHIGPGDYLLVFNRMNRLNPNSPFPRSFFPGAPNLDEAKSIHLKDAQQLFRVNIRLSEAFPTRKIRVLLKWAGGRPQGEVTVTATADQGENPAAHKIDDSVYQFSLLESAQYTISAWEDLNPQRGSAHRGAPACLVPARIEAPPAVVSGSDLASKQVTLVFAGPECTKQ
jgi:hypothetical protein